MVRFSCFNAHVHNHKTKKTGQPPLVTMQKMLQDCSQIQPRKESPNPQSADQVILKAEGDMQSQSNQVASPSIECGREMKMKLSTTDQVRGVGHLKKSQSLGSALYQHSKVSGENMDDETEEGFSFDGSYNNEFVPPDGSKGREVSLSNRCVKNQTSDSFQVSSGPTNNDSIFLIEEHAHPEKYGADNSDTVLSGECVGAYGDCMASPTRAIVKSSSLPNVGSTLASEAYSSPLKYVAPRSRSSEDLHVLETRHGESSAYKVETQVVPEKTKDDNIWRTGKNIVDNFIDDGYDSCNYAASAKDWIMPVAEEVSPVKMLKGESSAPQWEQVPNKDFKIKRIEEWVTDLVYCDPIEETGLSELGSYNDEVKREPTIPNGLADTKVDGKVTPGMEAAKRYISSLSASTTTAQLANHGLVVIPFLSAFVSLRVLNLSGNAIVRITAGALPRGLHMLNLSKNYISTIEGLRELTRLRVLDLSYNKIVRIGHGLASCSALKELYLAGNKISEVEGLHRLLKLTVLDLRFNKISTAKCLGQLAANYNSLQAISLEGNPAQKNVGDEQLKKNLQGLLPNLVYYNRQPTKASTHKDSAERSVRLGASAHQFDRGHSKGSRKGSQGSHKPNSSTQGRKSQAVLSPKPSRSRHGHGHGRLPPNPTGTKAMVQRNFDLSNKVLDLKSELAIRRSRSEGTLGAL